MKHSVLAVLMASSALLVACATEPAVPSSAAKPVETTTSASGNDEVLCSREYPTGSNIPISKCRTRKQIEAEKAVASESLRRTQTGGPNAKLGGAN